MSKAIIGIVVVLTMAGTGFWAWRSGVFSGAKLPPSEQRIGVAGGGVGIKGAAGSAILKVRQNAVEEELNITIREVPKEDWPEGAVGGVYQIEPHGLNFSTAIPFTMRFRETPPRGFSLAYWYPETKNWEDLSTFRVSANEYRIQIKHLSYIGGHAAKPAARARSASVGVSTPVATAITALDPSLFEIEQGQMRGTLSKEREAELWDRVHEHLDNAADLAAGLAEQNPSFESLFDLLAVEGLAQSFGFDDIDARLSKVSRKTLDTLADRAIEDCKTNPTLAAYQNLIKVIELAERFGSEDIESRAWAAEPKCKPSSYKIEQTDDTPININIPGLVSSQGTGTVTSVGQPNTPAKAELHGWQTSWNLIQDSKNDNTIDVQIDMGEVQSSVLDSQLKQAARSSLTFNLAGVKEGGSFPVRVVNMDHTFDSYRAPQDLIMRRGDIMTSESRITGSSESGSRTGMGGVFEGVLVKDLGEDGAVITFKLPVVIPGASMPMSKLRIVSGSLSPSGSADSTGSASSSVGSPSTPSSGKNTAPIVLPSKPSSLPKSPVPLRASGKDEKKDQPSIGGTMPADVNEFLKQYQQYQNFLKQNGVQAPGP